MQQNIELTKRQLAQVAYENAGREITQTFEVMNANLALAAGTLAALLAVLGAGELFSQSSLQSSLQSPPVTSPVDFPPLSTVSLFVLSLATPLILRFFVRSLTAYQNLLRFLGVQQSSWQYLAGTRSWRFFFLQSEIYYIRWRTPRPMKRLMWENLKYGFMWIVFVMMLALAWAFWSVDRWEPRAAAAGILALGLAWEILTLLASKKRYWVVPTEEEEASLESARSEPGEIEIGSPDGLVLSSVDPAPLFEETRGLFVGRRRLFRRSG